MLLRSRIEQLDFLEEKKQILYLLGPVGGGNEIVVRGLTSPPRQIAQADAQVSNVPSAILGEPSFGGLGRQQAIPFFRGREHQIVVF